MSNFPVELQQLAERVANLLKAGWNDLDICSETGLTLKAVQKMRQRYEAQVRP